MIIDKLAAFDIGATVTGGTTTVALNDYDQGSAKNLGSGTPMYVVIFITGNTGGDSGDTAVFSLVQDTALPIDGSSVVVVASATYTDVATFPAGTKIVLTVPPGQSLSRYLGLRYAVTATAVLTVTAFLTDDPGYDHSVYAQGSVPPAI